ncbi:hypothetical protein DFH06DRAFT_1438858 [Mycena polygramma]|nr:hypothetical protein DFH06DRAFT_1438858 [Mycena polygramma]
MLLIACRAAADIAPIAINIALQHGTTLPYSLHPPPSLPTPSRCHNQGAPLSGKLNHMPRFGLNLAQAPASARRKHPVSLALRPTPRRWLYFMYGVLRFVQTPRRRFPRCRRSRRDTDAASAPRRSFDSAAQTPSSRRLTRFFDWTVVLDYYLLTVDIGFNRGRRGTFARRALKRRDYVRIDPDRSQFKISYHTLHGLQRRNYDCSSRPYYHKPLYFDSTHIQSLPNAETKVWSPETMQLQSANQERQNCDYIHSDMSTSLQSHLCLLTSQMNVDDSDLETQPQSLQYQDPSRNQKVLYLSLVSSYFDSSIYQLQIHSTIYIHEVNTTCYIDPPIPNLTTTTTQRKMAWASGDGRDRFGISTNPSNPDCIRLTGTHSGAGAAAAGAGSGKGAIYLFYLGVMPLQCLPAQIEWNRSPDSNSGRIEVGLDGWPAGFGTPPTAFVSAGNRGCRGLEIETAQGIESARDVIGQVQRRVSRSSRWQSNGLKSIHADNGREREGRVGVELGKAVCASSRRDSRSRFGTTVGFRLGARWCIEVFKAAAHVQMSSAGGRGEVDAFVLSLRTAGEPRSSAVSVTKRSWMASEAAGADSAVEAEDGREGGGEWREGGRRARGYQAQRRTTPTVQMVECEVRRRCGKAAGLKCTCDTGVRDRNVDESLVDGKDKAAR